MFPKKTYKNFVKASSPENHSVNDANRSVISGDEARRLYLEEVKDARASRLKTSKLATLETRRRNLQTEEEVPVTNKDIFITIQNDDVDKLKQMLNKYPEKINIVDDYGWSLLMIACQANSIGSVKELIERGVDISVRDKAGNSARSLVIKNKNYAIAELLLNSKEPESKSCMSHHNIKTDHKHRDTKEYMCDVCNKTFPDREEHLSSTLHNISASKGKKAPANYVIPASNVGYQLMLKGGWDRDSGLGRNGSGKIYPIKTVPKKDRKGLGHGKRKHEESPKESIKRQSRKMFENNYKNNRQFEINFRREFY